MPSAMIYWVIFKDASTTTLTPSQLRKIDVYVGAVAHAAN